MQINSTRKQDHTRPCATEESLRPKRFSAIMRASSHLPAWGATDCANGAVLTGDKRTELHFECAL